MAVELRRHRKSSIEIVTLPILRFHTTRTLVPIFLLARALSKQSQSCEPSCPCRGCADRNSPNTPAPSACDQIMSGRPLHARTEEFQPLWAMAQRPLL